MMAETHDVVTALNHGARLDRMLEGTISTRGSVRLHDGTEATARDLVITGRNDRRLLAGRGFVKNGDRWVVTATSRDGSATLRRAGHRRGASVTLPASYVADEVEVEGSYFTDRYTKGDMTIKLIDRSYGYGSFNDAQAIADKRAQSS